MGVGEVRVRTGGFASFHVGEKGVDLGSCVFELFENPNRFHDDVLPGSIIAKFENTFTLYYMR